MASTSVLSFIYFGYSGIRMKRTTWLATIPLAAVVALEFSLLPALAGASGVHLRPYAVSYPGTGFGGYQVGANAREIAATITVPTIGNHVTRGRRVNVDCGGRIAQSLPSSRHC